MSRKAAINKHCCDCIYDINGEGSWVQQVTACSDYKCALFNVRPITTGKADVRKLLKTERKAERHHSREEGKRVKKKAEKARLNSTAKQLREEWV